MSNSDVILAESLYVRIQKSQCGDGGTSRECVMESLWFPYRVEDGFVELFPVMDNLKQVMRLKERITVEEFQNEYSEQENSRDIYLNLKSNCFKKRL